MVPFSNLRILHFQDYCTSFGRFVKVKFSSKENITFTHCSSFLTLGLWFRFLCIHLKIVSLVEILPRDAISFDSGVKLGDNERGYRQSSRKSQTNDHFSICPAHTFVFVNIVRLSIPRRSISRGSQLTTKLPIQCSRGKRLNPSASS